MISPMIAEIILSNLRELIPYKIVKQGEQGVYYSRGVAKPLIWQSPLVSKPFRAQYVSNPLQPGGYWFIPYLHEIRIESTREDWINLAVQSAVTKDGKAVSFSLNVGWRVTDAVKRQLAVVDLADNIQQRAMAHLYGRIRERTLEELLAADGNLRRGLQQTLSTKFTDWGVEIMEVGFTDLVQSRHYRLFQEHG